ncbi:hypothetical protein K450DRAFT_234412 [Umbelopsis ramanniana AG]|uniref:HeH/LEM domain-containing protein n=1 Tax=Umbelopsis ramanniana AG TaxID=1314678 RepID=A0AAD5EDP6_UMBRA|nr:uncharacterized protein K450DRAFT_234412 [Umbelopsis ramanniana AG]KAI8581051.1 hypothetical protein K450DRAFT_234412 [Umbelopsis ramanniana AG]
MEDDLFYLEPDFMPSTLRAVDLRSLLLQHNVAYPMRATKPELVEIFKEQVIANASEILKNSKKTNSRSAFSQGIQDVDDTWSSGDEAPVNLIKSKEEISRAQVKSPRRSVVKEVTSTSPKRTRKPKKLQLTETPKDHEVIAKPEEPEQPSQHVEEPATGETGDVATQEEDKESKTIEMVEKDTFVKPTKPAPRKIKARKPRADRSWIKPKAVHSGLTSDSDSDFGDRQKSGDKSAVVESSSQFPNFMDKSLLASPETDNAVVDTAVLSQNQSVGEPMTPESEKEHMFSSSTAEQPRRSLRIRRANSKDVNTLENQSDDLNVEQNEKEAEHGEASAVSSSLYPETVTTIFEEVVTEVEADDEAEPSAIALAKGKQRAKKMKQKRVKKPSPRLCQLLAFILTMSAFWYFISQMTLPKGN